MSLTISPIAAPLAHKAGVFQTDAAEGEIAYAIFNRAGKRIARVEIPLECFDMSVIDRLEDWLEEKDRPMRIVT